MGRRYIHVRGYPYFHEDKQVTLAVIVSEDTTERRATEIALQQNEERFWTMVSNIPGAVYRCCYNHSHWAVKYISPVLSMFTGYTASQLTDNRLIGFDKLIYEDDAQTVARAIEKAIRDHQPYELEYRILNQEGIIRRVYDSGQRLFDENGKLSFVEEYCLISLTRRKPSVKFTIITKNFVPNSSLPPIYKN